MMILDPTYLRTIYDGLNSGAIHKDNASALPTGLVGIYEAAFPPTSNVNDRNKVLDFFTVWSLLRREVSAAFILPLLEGWKEEQLLEYIAQYSKWFNSPVSGKYQLYHERFRAFILQKISHQQISTCNDLIINQCQRALLEKNGNEWELYALECLSKHLLIKAMENGDGSALKSLAYNTTHWNRQIEISMGFEWSKKSIYHCLNFLNYKNDILVADYYLLLIKLKHMEEDSIQLTIRLFNENKANIAIERLRNISYSGYSAQSRQFTGYILCLIESIRINNGRFKTNEITFIKEVLQDLEGLVMDFDWFMPKGLLFIIYIESKRIGINANFLFEKTYINVNKFIENNKYNLDELFWTYELIISKINTYEKKEDLISNFIKTIKLNHSQSLLDKLIKLIEEDSCEFNIKQILKEINSQIYFEKSSLKQKTSENILDLKITNDSYDDYESQIANKIDEFIESNTIDNVILELPIIIKSLSSFIHGINSKSDKDEILNLINDELIKNNEFEKAIKLLPEKRDLVLIKISNIIAKRESLEIANLYIEKIDNQSKKDNTLLNIAQNYIKENRIIEAISILQNLYNKIRNEPIENRHFNFALDLAFELLKLNFRVEADLLLQKSLNLLNTIFDKNEVKKGFTDLNFIKYRNGIAFNKLAQFVNNDIFIKYLDENIKFNEIFIEYLNFVKENMTKSESKKIDSDFINNELMEIGDINSSARNLSLEKLRSLDITSINRNQFLSLVNRYMFFKDIGYVKEINIRKHLFELRFELDELEIFFNIWTLHSLFIDNKIELAEKWNETLNIQWALNIKNSFSEN
jgi:hypothetical protein